MELKNAVAVCLISLFSATLVVLIAQSLDNQAAARLEPQLAGIVEELQALRAQGQIGAVSGAGRIDPRVGSVVEELQKLMPQSGIDPKVGSLLGELQKLAPQSEAAPLPTVRDGLVIYYFHSNIRCPTCRSIETQAHETVKTHFASQLNNGKMVWRIVNYEQPSAKSLAEKFQLQMPVVVLARMKDGKVMDWKRLDEVWAFVGDKPAFTKYVRGEIERMLSPGEKSEAPTAQTPKPTLGPEARTPKPILDKKPEAQTPEPTIPVPNADSVPAKDTPAIPTP